MITAVLAPILLLPWAASTLEDGAQLEYRGLFFASKGDPLESRKTFRLQLLVSPVGADGAAASWTLDETGRGGWNWPDRFGRVELNGRWQPQSARGPALLYERADGKSVVPIPLPLLPQPDGPLEASTSWEWGKLQHSVVDSGRVQQRDCWKVEARNAYGVRRTIWVDKQSPVIVALRERVFIGQGEEHELQIELAAASTLPPEQRAATLAGLGRLQMLLDQTGREPQSREPTWNDQQLATLKAEVATLAPFRAVAMLEPIVATLEQDVKNQKGRAGAVTALRDRIVGQSVAGLKLETVQGEPLGDAAWRDKVTVLHFWEYRDSPLEEPYGQVGYLDFLFRKLKGQGVAIYGVAVDPAASEPAGKRKTIQAANRMKAFMNLSYPLLVDDGAALKRLGDPRVAGAELPLFVVIGRDGKVVEFHPGHFEVDRDRGLAELEKILTKAAGSRE